MPWLAPLGRRAVVACLLVAGIAALRPASALADTGAGDLAARQMAVRELMRLETSAALHRARRQRQDRQRQDRQRPDAGGSVPATTARAENLALLAVYGVGEKLLARVLHDGKTYVYVRGHVLPVGMRSADDTSVFRLQGMSSGCVELRRGKQSRTLCLPPALLSGG